MTNQSGRRQIVRELDDAIRTLRDDSRLVRDPMLSSRISRLEQEKMWIESHAGERAFTEASR